MSGSRNAGGSTLTGLAHDCRDCSLSELCLPVSLDSDAVDQLSRIVEQGCTLRKGDHLYQAGDGFRAIYAVHSGALKTTELALDGEEQILGFHLPGELVGLDAISDERHPCTAVALETTSVCTLPYRRLEELAASIPGLQRQLLRVMSREIFADHEMLHAMARRSAEARLAIILLNLSERFARRGWSGSRLRLPMTRGELSNYLGVAPETLSRLLKRFHEDGWIRAEGREVELMELERLRELSGHSETGGGSAYATG
jgi:CRP/FNR family transcriptional regulator